MLPTLLVLEYGHLFNCATNSSRDACQHDALTGNLFPGNTPEVVQVAATGRQAVVICNGKRGRLVPRRSVMNRPQHGQRWGNEEPGIALYVHPPLDSWPSF